MVKPRRTVAICIDKSRSFGRGVLRGVADYVETHRRWSLFLDPRASGAYGPDWLRNWQGDGILGFIDDPLLAAALRKARIPAVELFGHRFDLGLPHVGNDEEAFGKLAAQHLLDRQFKHFAFVGMKAALWSARRLDGFAAALGPARVPAVFQCSGRVLESPAQSEIQQRRLQSWLLRLPKPLAVMAASDRLALRVLDACRSANLIVPEQTAVIGVDNDEETCRLADPPLSSVVDNAPAIGWRAAALLDSFMDGKSKPSNQRVLLPPAGVAVRRSTDVTAVNDPLVARACQLIRERAGSGLSAVQLARELRVSRTLFYARFKKALDRLPHQEIARTRLEQAKAMLVQTALPAAEIAHRCGFNHPEYLNVAFKRQFGQTPGAFRRQNAQHPDCLR